MTKSKIGFVDTDALGEEQNPTMGHAEAYEEDDDSSGGFINNVLLYFLLCFGALSLLKEVTLFLVRLFKRG